MRQEELLKRVPRNVEVAINRLTTRALYDSDKEDKTDLSDDQYSPNPDGPVGERFVKEMEKCKTNLTVRFLFSVK